MKNALKVAALSLVVVLTLAGCFKAKIDVTLNSDDTVSGTMLVAIQAGAGESLGSSDDEILGQLTDGLATDLGDTTVEDYSQDGYVGKIYAFKNQPLDAFSSGDEGSDISITREGDLFIVDGTWNTEDADTEGLDPASLGAEFTFSVTFPGGVVEHNGSLSEDGHTVTWDLFNAPDTLHAKGGATEDNTPWLLWVVVGVVALLILAAVIVTAVVVRRRQNHVTAPADEAATPYVSPAPVDFSADAPPAPEAPEAPEAPADEQPK